MRFSLADIIDSACIPETRLAGLMNSDFCYPQQFKLKINIAATVQVSGLQQLLHVW